MLEGPTQSRDQGKVALLSCWKTAYQNLVDLPSQCRWGNNPIALHFRRSSRWGCSGFAVGHCFTRPTPSHHSPMQMLHRVEAQRPKHLDGLPAAIPALAIHQNGTRAVPPTQLQLEGRIPPTDAPSTRQHPPSCLTRSSNIQHLKAGVSGEKLPGLLGTQVLRRGAGLRGKQPGILSGFPGPPRR